MLSQFDIQVVVTAETVYNFNDKLRKLISQNSIISPIVLGSPYSFVNEYAVNILTSKQNFAQVTS